MRMAEGRTSMCGRTLLSILRRSRGSREYCRLSDCAILSAYNTSAHLCYELALPELSVDQCDITILVELGTTQLQLVARLDDAPP